MGRDNIASKQNNSGSMVLPKKFTSIHTINKAGLTVTFMATN